MFGISFGKKQSQKVLKPAQIEIKQLISSTMGCIATNRITIDGAKVGYMYREQTDGSHPDSGWRFFAGDEDEAYIKDNSNSRVFALNTIANFDPDIIPFLESPIGAAYERDSSSNKLVRIKSSTDTLFQQLVEKRSAYQKTATSEFVDFNRFFDKDLASGIPLTTLKIGDLILSTGTIVACDPIYAGSDFTKPFEKNVLPGKYSTYICSGKFKQMGERVICTKVKFSDTEVIRWEVANTIEPHQPYSPAYWVDAGLGCFMDIETEKLLATAEKEHGKDLKISYYDDVMEKDFGDHMDWAVHRPFADNPLNVMVIHSGLGDGVYYSYWGYDKNDTIAALVTDFQLFDLNGPISD